MANNTRDIKTQYGDYKISVLGDIATLYGSREPEEEQYLTINGISFNGSIHLKYEIYRNWKVRDDKDNGVEVKGWHMDNSPLYLRRKGFPFGGIITDGMHTKIREVLVPGVAAYLEAHPEFVHEGWLAFYEIKMNNALRTAQEAFKAYEVAQGLAMKAGHDYAEFINGTLKAPMPDDVCTCGHIRQYHDERWCTQWQPDNTRRCGCEGFVHEI